MNGSDFELASAPKEGKRMLELSIHSVSPVHIVSLECMPRIIGNFKWRNIWREINCNLQMYFTFWNIIVSNFKPEWLCLQNMGLIIDCFEKYWCKSTKISFMICLSFYSRVRFEKGGNLWVCEKWFRGLCKWSSKWTAGSGRGRLRYTIYKFRVYTKLKQKWGVWSIFHLQSS